jgi:alpha-glucosidase (family GH31 glycosyl hydrolase)
MKKRFQYLISFYFTIIYLATCSFKATAQQPHTEINKSKQDTVTIISVEKINTTTVDVQLSNKQHMLFDFYGDNIFRWFYDKTGGLLRDPESQPAANILVDNPRKPVQKLQVTSSNNTFNISTGKIYIELDKSSTGIKILNKELKIIVETLAPVSFDKKKVSLHLKENAQEYFYGGGVQNGRFSHKGKTIAIENQNSWTDGGVASPTPFFWSTNGYGMLWYTLKKGKYDFGNKEPGVVSLSHETNYLDVFFMVDKSPETILNDFYQLTGHPVLLPKFAFYEGHLNAYNRDFWKADSSAILFEDAKRYKESQKDNGGTKESLNGEIKNYQFSARAVIDRYKSNDFPLGWILPNDGYGAGYGQTNTLDSNILNLKSFSEYARRHGVYIGLWTQSDLHPKDSIPALLQRDIVKEVGVAGVRVLKTDVAWVGQGYSFGLNAVAEVSKIIPQYGDNARPFIITLDGWAGTQRYAGVWTGDQTGGMWEYIRFHIPTYLGSGLSGQPNITSDMDGIFGGKNAIINTRDFQWKTFTPMELNMDGWGSNEKYPFALGEPATSINRTYLKLKSELIPYTYSIAKESITGLPMMRAMFLEYPGKYTFGTHTQYQYMYGPSFLVAPVYKSTNADTLGNDIRNGIYLPKGQWIDYFTGNMYSGDCILNNFKTPIWKLPLFIKNGAIIPLANPNNNVTEIDKSLRIYEIFPAGKSYFNEYDDDGVTESNKKGNSISTLIESSQQGNMATITIHPTKGNFAGFVKNKTTEFRINVTQPPSSVMASVGNQKIKLRKAVSKQSFIRQTNVYFYDPAPNLNGFATKGTEFEKLIISRNPQLLVKIAATDITKNKIQLIVNGFIFAPTDQSRTSSGPLISPLNAHVTDTNRKAYTLKPSWNKVPNADYYEIEFDGQRYTHIKDTSLSFEDLLPETNYTFKLRSVNKVATSPWTSFSARTQVNPLEFAIKGIMAYSTTPAEEGTELSNLFDFDESSMWHSKWGEKAVPFNLVLDLMSINQVDKIQYLPRNRGNGIIMKGKVSYSLDKINWNEADSFKWIGNGDVKEFKFQSHPLARYIKIAITEGVGGYGSGREIYVFKVPGSESHLIGDINNDNRIDNNDLISYRNYTGLRKGDSDFEGYISKGDENKNNLIDAYDISTVATRLEGGANTNKLDSLTGSLMINPNKRTYEKNEIVELRIKGSDLRSVNALSFALPYNNQDFDFVGITPINLVTMENMTNDRVHSNGEKVLYPTFVNIGEGETLQGSMDLFVIKMKAKHKINYELKPIQGILVDTQLNTLKF